LNSFTSKCVSTNLPLEKSYSTFLQAFEIEKLELLRIQTPLSAAENENKNGQKK
jgi:hypothetical protein